jgi:hypothetical protein
MIGSIFLKSILWFMLGMKLFYIMMDGIVAYELVHYFPQDKVVFAQKIRDELHKLNDILLYVLLVIIFQPFIKTILTTKTNEMLLPVDKIEQWLLFIYGCLALYHTTL